MTDTPQIPGEMEKILTEDRFLRSLAASLLGSGPDAEDAAQHAWLQSLERPPRQTGALRAFLRAVLKNRVRESMRTEDRRARRERVAARHEAVPSAEEMASQEELRRRVGEAVMSLEEPYRATVWLRFREQLPPREVARRMGVPVETVRTRSRRALDELRRRLDRSYGDRQSWVSALAPMIGARLSGTAASVSWVGVLAMKKVLFGVGAAALLVAVTLTTLNRGPQGSELARTTPVTTAESPGQQGELLSQPATQEPVAARQAVPSARWMLRGHVRTADGGGVAGSRVEAAIHRGDRVTPLGAVTSEDDGGYELDLERLRSLSILQRATASLRVSASAPGLFTKAPAELSEFSFGEETARSFELDVPVVSGTRLSGRVLTVDGRAADGAAVNVWWRSPTGGAFSSRQFKAATDRGGYYSLLVDRSGKFDMSAGTLAMGFTRHDLGSFELGKDLTVPDLHLWKFHTVEARLVVEDGSPLAGVFINVNRVGVGTYSMNDTPPIPYDMDLRKPMRSRRYAGITTDGDGVFRIAVMEEGDYVVRVWDALRNQQQFTIPADSGRSLLTVKGQALVVRVTDQNGDPLPGHSLTYKGWAGGKNPAEDLSGYDIQFASGNNPNPEGESRFLLPYGSAWMYEVASSESVRRRAEWKVHEGVASGELTIALDPLRDPDVSGSLELIVRNDRGEPIQDYTARIGFDFQELDGTVHPGGKYGPEDVAAGPLGPFRPGRYSIRITSGHEVLGAKTNFVTDDRVEIRPNEVSTASITVQRGGLLRMRLFPPVGDQVEDWRRLRVRTDSMRQSDLVVSTFYLATEKGWIGHVAPPVGERILCGEPLVPGRHRLTISADGFADEVIDADIAPGEVTDVDVYMRRRK